MKIRLLAPQQVGRVRFKAGSVIEDWTPRLARLLPKWVADGQAVELKDIGAAPSNKALQIVEDKSTFAKASADR